MFKILGIVAAIGAAAFAPATRAGAQHLHFGSGGVGVHFGDDHHDDHHHDDHHDSHHHDDHLDWHGDHWDVHHSGHDDWHHHYHSDWHDSDWLFVVPQFGSAYRGTYYSDQGNYYYMPQAPTGNYQAAKPIEIQFGGYAHVADLSGRLERLANELCLDLHYNYRHNVGYPDIYRLAYQVLNSAKFIRVEANQANRDEVARRLDGLDVAFHNVEGAVQGWSRRQNRQIGKGGAQTKLDLVEATLHHLMYDVGVAGAHGAPQSATMPESGEVAPPPEPVAAPTP
jgi:hypothetical protein